jgi:Uma2 family endonuclease
MPIAPSRLREHQERWNEIVGDPTLLDLPYKVETNERGQIVLSPHPNRHSDLQEAISDFLREYTPEGRQPQEYALATPEGTKVPDVVWISPERKKKMEATGDPSTLAPEICVEVMSPTNTEAEMREKRQIPGNWSRGGLAG